MKTPRFFALTLLLALLPRIAFSDTSVQLPNVIFILADDLGYGDLSIMGQGKLSTPNIDRLGHEGLVFTDHYAGNTVCSPSRASLMTGQHPGVVHCRSNMGDEALAALDPEMTVLPELFKRAGFATGAFGKWGLGVTSVEDRQSPLVHGFDTFSGWKSQRIAHTYYPSSIVRDGVELPLDEGVYVHDVIMADAFAFVRSSAEAGRPFFCYIPTAIPHAAMHAPEALHQKWRERFPQFERKVGKYRAGGEPCPDVVNPIAGFAAMMEHLDTQVGALLDLIEELDIDDNTLFVFSSDNGPHSEGGHDPVFWNSNGLLAGKKRDLREGGIRVPLLMRWPAAIEAGGRTDLVSANWDLLATFAEILGQSVPAQSAGVSLLPTLKGQRERQRQHDFLYWETVEKGIKMAVRQGKWKGLLTQEGNGGEKEVVFRLFDLSQDIGEERDLAGRHPERVREMLGLMRRARTPDVHFDETLRPLIDRIDQALSSP